MLNNYVIYIYLCVFALVSFSCANDDDSYIPINNEPIQVSPVIFDIDVVPYQTLSEYNFFKDTMSDLDPVYGVLPYKIISGLFIDYAQAKTFLWMPSNVEANYVNDYSVFDFPEGTVLITTHYFENVLPEQNTKMIETRLLIKKEGEWIMANYVWNEEQSEATFTTDGSFVSIDWVDDNETKSVNYKIPSYAECFTCHNKYEVILPIGPKPQNLNHSILFDDGEQNQLSKWADFGYLNNNYPSNIVSTVDWGDSSQPLGLRARSYLDINCAHCHSDRGYCEYRSMRFAFNKTSDLSNMGICVEPDTQINNEIPYIISPGNADASVMLFRVSATLEEYRMPIIGRTLQHQEGVRLLEEWINSLNVVCN